MSGRRDIFDRIASALERIAPPVEAPVDWLGHPAYLWDGARTRPIDALEALALEQLRGIDAQKSAVTTNFERLANGAAAHDALLWGARGMGKSALLRAAVKVVQADSPGKLAIIQLAPGSLGSLADLLEQLSQVERAFVLFIDDLGFGASDSGDVLALRSLLDGGVVARPANVRLAVTSNRRAIVTREAGESEAIHERDERDNALALADRFGLTLAFHPCDRATYLDILSGYTEPAGLAFEEEEALAWAIARGNRSGRTAYQFACELAGRAGIHL